MTKKLFLSHLNEMRLKNKNQWYYFHNVVEGVTIKLKGYGTWIQRIEMNGITLSGPMDCKVSEFKSFLKSIVETKDETI